MKSMTSDDFMVLFSTFTEYNMMITLSKVQIKVKDEDNAAVFHDWVMSCYCAVYVSDTLLACHTHSSKCSA